MEQISITGYRDVNDDLANNLGEGRSYEAVPTQTYTNQLTKCLCNTYWLSSMTLAGWNLTIEITCGFLWVPKLCIMGTRMCGWNVICNPVHVSAGKHHDVKAAMGKQLKLNFVNNIIIFTMDSI